MLAHTLQLCIVRPSHVKSMAGGRTLRRVVDPAAGTGRQQARPGAGQWNPQRAWKHTDASFPNKQMAAYDGCTHAHGAGSTLVRAPFGLAAASPPHASSRTSWAGSAHAHWRLSGSVSPTAWSAVAGGVRCCVLGGLAATLRGLAAWAARTSVKSARNVPSGSKTSSAGPALSQPNI